jgi:hypothetical protein
MTELPVIGMSPGNSYFKDEVVKELLKKVVNQYDKAVVMIADIPAISRMFQLKRWRHPSIVLLRK